MFKEPQDYEKILELQKKIRKDIISGKHGEGVVLILSHKPVITMGIRGNRSNILMNDKELSEKKISLVKIRRGGDVTYHSPRQCIIYPILNFKKTGFRSVRDFVTWWGNFLAELIKEKHEISQIKWSEKQPGIWKGKKKIASVGFHFKKFVAIHGFAVNIKSDVNVFRMMYPCGMKNIEMTSIFEETGRSLSVTAFADDIVGSLGKIGFNLTPWKEIV